MAEEQARMSDPGTGSRSPDEIRDEIERTRSQFHETVDALERRLTPGELFDEFWNRMRSSSGGAGGVVRDHPVPLALMGLGLGWLAIEKATGNGPDAERRHQDGPAVAFEPDTSMYWEDDAPGRMDRLKQKASSVRESASHLGDRATDAKDRVTDAASSAGHRVSETASHATERARESAEHAKHRARDTARRAQDQFDRIRREQPLALGAVTFGIGLAAGLLAPVSDWENEHVGPASDRVKETARETADEVRDVAREVAGEAKQVAREAKDSIEESARDTEGQSIGERIGDAVDRAKETVAFAAGEHDIDREGLRERGREIADHTRDNVREARDDMRGEPYRGQGSTGTTHEEPYRGQGSTGTTRSMGPTRSAGDMGPAREADTRSPSTPSPQRPGWTDRDEQRRR